MPLLHISCKANDGSNKCFVSIPHQLHPQNVIFKKSVIRTLLNGGVVASFDQTSTLYAQLAKGKTSIFSNQEVMNSDDMNAYLPLAYNKNTVHSESDYHIAFESGMIPSNFEVNFYDHDHIPQPFIDATQPMLAQDGKLLAVDLYFEISDITYSNADK